MKCEIKNIENPEFQPFQLTIQIETKDQLMNLWHRFNASESVFLPVAPKPYSCGNELIKKIPLISTSEIYRVLNARIEKYNLQKGSD